MGARSSGGASILGGPRKEAGHDCNLRSTGILGDTRKEARVKRSLGGTTGSSLGGESELPDDPEVSGAGEVLGDLGPGQIFLLSGVFLSFYW